MIYSSFYWKQKAREALRGNWQIALLICLVVNLPSLLTQGIASVTGNDLMVRLQQAIYASATQTGGMDMTVFQTRMDDLMQTAGLWVMQGIYLLVWLMTPCLAMGMYAWMLKRLRGQEGSFADVFSRVRLFLKAMGLRLYTALRIFLFMLPGLALSVLSMIPVWTADTTSRIAVLSSVNTAMGLATVSSIVTLVLCVLGFLHYALADIVMADQPEVGIRAAAKKSREMMKRRKGQLFALFLSFILWYFLEMFLSNLILGMFGTIAGLMTEMLCSLALNVYLYTSVCSFYRTILQEEKGEQAEEEEADETEEDETAGM